MVRIFGVCKVDGFRTLTKKLIGVYTREKAAQILLDRDFIKRWNENHIIELIQLIFETDI